MNALKRQDYMLQKAEGYARYQRLVAFSDLMERKVCRFSGEAVDQLVGELKAFVALTKKSFEREELQKEIIRLELCTEDDLGTG